MEGRLVGVEARVEGKVYISFDLLDEMDDCINVS